MPHSAQTTPIAHRTATGPIYSRTPEGKAHLAKLITSVKAHQPPASAPPSHDLPRTHPGSRGDAWEAPTGAGRDQEPLPIDTTDYSETT